MAQTVTLERFDPIPDGEWNVIVEGKASGPFDKRDLDHIRRTLGGKPLVLTRENTLGNEVAQAGCDRCPCGCKYWEHDRCVDCGTPVTAPEVERASS